MSMQICHIVFADQIQQRLARKFSEKEFFIGNVFPDIRYPTGLDRAITHHPMYPVSNLSLGSIEAAATPFEAGIVSHCLIDQLTHRFREERGLYELVVARHGIAYPDRSLKLLEEELFYTRFSRWPAVTEYLQTILPEERLYPIEAPALTDWHQAVSAYIQQPPHQASEEAFAQALGFSEDKITDVFAQYDRIRQDQDMLKAMQQLPDFLAIQLG